MAKKKYKFFVVSDIHGDYTSLLEGLRAVGYDQNNSEHFFVSLGDAFDRGPDSRKIYNFFKGLPKDRSIFLKGNHDLMLQDYIVNGGKGDFVLFNILHNGLRPTIESFASIQFAENRPITISMLDDLCMHIKHSYPDLRDYLKSMPLWFETEHTIMVHAGLNPDLVDWRQTDADFALWDVDHAVDFVGTNGPKTIIFGHIATHEVKRAAQSRGYQIYNLGRNGINVGPLTVIATGDNKQDPPIFIKDINKVAIDGCTILNKKVNVIVFSDYIEVPDPEPVAGGPSEPSVVIKATMDQYGNIISQSMSTEEITTGTYANTWTMPNVAEPRWYNNV